MRNYYIVILVISTIACTSPHSQIEEISIPKLSLEEDSIKFYVKELNYTFLEQTKTSYLNSPSKVIMKNDYIYVMDYFSGKSLLKVFKTDGTFVGQINKFGKGPGEFVQLTDFSVNDISQIIIWDNALKKILIFNDDLNLIKEENLDYRYSRIAYINDTTILALNTSKAKSKRAYILNNELSEILSGIDLTESYSVYYGSWFHHFSVNGFISYRPIYCDTIFHIYSNRISPVYRLNFNQKIIPYNIVDSGIDFNDVKYQKYTSSVLAIETNDIVLINYLCKAQRHLALYDKESRKIKQFKITTFRKCNCGPLINFLGASNNSYLAIINPEDNINFLEITTSRSTSINDLTKDSIVVDTTSSIFIMLEFNISF